MFVMLSKMSAPQEVVKEEMEIIMSMLEKGRQERSELN